MSPASLAPVAFFALGFSAGVILMLIFSNWILINLISRQLQLRVEAINQLLTLSKDTEQGCHRTIVTLAAVVVSGWIENGRKDWLLRNITGFQVKNLDLDAEVAAEIRKFRFIRQFSTIENRKADIR